MAGEPDQRKWFGVRPTDPEEAIPVKQGVAANLKVQATIAAAQVIGIFSGAYAGVKATVIGDDAFPIKVKQDTAANLKVEAAIAAAQSIAVTQATATNLKAEVINSYIARDTVFDHSVDPAGAAVLSDTGELTVGIYDFLVLCSTSVNHAGFELFHMNSANTVVRERWTFMTCAYIPVILHINNWYMDEDQRIKLSMYTGITGSVFSSIAWVRRI